MSALLRGASTSAFDGLYRRHAASVYRYALAVLGNHADAEDVTQTTFMNAYRALAQGVKPRKAENWLLTIAHNQIRQHFRRTLGKPLEVELDETAGSTADPDERDEPSVADVLRALQKLTPGQRAAIVMREFEGRSYAEMAEILGLTPSALEALLFRARRALTDELEESLTCGEAERSLSRKLDGRLARREARRLKAHMRGCARCRRFDDAQRRQRTALKGLSLLPVPVSVLLFRSETAAAAGLGAAGAGAGAGATGLAGTGIAAGLGTAAVGKVAAVTAATAVAVGGVGYGVTKTQGPSSVDRAAALAQTRKGARAEQVKAAKARGERPGPAATASDRARAATAAARDRARTNAAGRKPATTGAARAAERKTAAGARRAAATAKARSQQTRSAAAEAKATPTRSAPNRATPPGLSKPPATSRATPTRGSAAAGRATGRASVRERVKPTR
jgi:RNA polymerase sigma factor (sigma-70 family)